MKPSRYLESFKALKDVKEHYKLIGGYLLVENIPQEEIKTQSGIILSAGGKQQINSVDANLPQFVHVLAVGEGYYDEEKGTDVALDTKVGDILLVGRNSVKWLPAMPVSDYTLFSIGITAEAETQMRFKGVEGYDAVFKAIEEEARRLSGEAAKEVGKTPS